MGWRDWFTRSSVALQVDRWLAWIEGVGAGVAALVVIAGFVLPRPVDGIDVLFVPAVPLLAVGQLWIIGVLNARLPRPRGSWWNQWKAQIQAQRNSRIVLFGALPSWASYGLMTAIVLGWLAGMTSFFSLSQGGPMEGLPGCRWPLQSHGAVTCVSVRTYEEAARAEQRLVGGVFMFFFVVHAGVAANEVVRRRRDAVPH